MRQTTEKPCKNPVNSTIVVYSIFSFYECFFRVAAYLIGNETCRKDSLRCLCLSLFGYGLEGIDGDFIPKPLTRDVIP
jgi:hypothetical protein